MELKAVSKEENSQQRNRDSFAIVSCVAES